VLPAERRAEYGPMLESSALDVVTDLRPHREQARHHAFRQQRSALSGGIGELVDERSRFVAAGATTPGPARLSAASRGHRSDDGVPQQDRGKFQHWSDELALVAFGAGGNRAGRQRRALAGQGAAGSTGRLIARRRRAGEDMISVLLSGSDEDGTPGRRELMRCAR